MPDLLVPQKLQRTRNPANKTTKGSIMKKVICLMAVLSIILLMGAKKKACCPKENAKCQTIEKAILQTHAEILKAAEATDIEKLYSFVLDHDKGAIAQNGQLYTTHEEAVNATKQAFEGLQSIRYQFDKKLVNVLCPTIAVLTSSGSTVVVTNSGRTITTPFANTSVFVLQDDQWKIAHGHHSIPNSQ